MEGHSSRGNAEGKGVRTETGMRSILAFQSAKRRVFYYYYFYWNNTEKISMFPAQGEDILKWGGCNKQKLGARQGGAHL